MRSKSRGLVIKEADLSRDDSVVGCFCRKIRQPGGQVEECGERSSSRVVRSCNVRLSCERCCIALSFMSLILQVLHCVVTGQKSGGLSQFTWEMNDQNEG